MRKTSKEIWLLSIIAAMTIAAVGCAAEQPIPSDNNAPYLSEPSSTNATEERFVSEIEVPYTANTLESDTEQEVDSDYGKYAVTLLNKYTEWSAVNDDVAGALCLMRKGEKEPFDCYVPVIHSDNVGHYATHYYDGRSVKGGSTQILGSDFKYGKPGGWMLIFGYRLGVNSYLDTGFSTEYNTIYLIMDGDNIQFRVFGIEEIALEHTMDYPDGIIPTEVHGLVKTIESYTDEERLAYYEQKANIAQYANTVNDKVLILCSDGKDNDAVMTVLYAYEISLSPST